MTFIFYGLLHHHARDVVDTRSNLFICHYIAGVVMLQPVEVTSYAIVMMVTNVFALSVVVSIGTYVFVERPWSEFAGALLLPATASR